MNTHSTEYQGFLNMWQFFNPTVKPELHLDMPLSVYWVADYLGSVASTCQYTGDNLGSVTSICQCTGDTQHKTRGTYSSIYTLSSLLDVTAFELSFWFNL